MGIRELTLLVLLPWCILVGCQVDRKKLDGSISVSELIRSRDVFDGRPVVVHGWIEIDPETYRLWDDQGSMISGSESANCVGVVVPSDIRRARYDGKHVVVYGEFISSIIGKHIVLGGCKDRGFIFINRIELSS